MTLSAIVMGMAPETPDSQGSSLSLGSQVGAIKRTAMAGSCMQKDAKRMQHGRLYLPSVRMIAIRGKAREIGPPRTCEIMCKGDKWYASITINCSPVRESGKRANALDCGVNKFAIQANDLGLVKTIENPRHTKSMLPQLEALQPAFAYIWKGSKSCKRLAKMIGTVHRKTANRRKDFLHQESAKLVKDSAITAT